MPGYKASVELIQKNFREGRSPKTSQAARNVLRDVSSFGPNTPGLDRLKSDLEQLILKLEAEELKLEREKEMVVTPIPVREAPAPVMVPAVAGFTLAKPRQDLVKQVQEQIVVKSNTDHSRWMASSDE